MSELWICVRWLAAADNGSHIDHYVVEGETNGVWSEISKSKSKHALIPKLQPATKYTFRLAAVNQFGKRYWKLRKVNLEDTFFKKK